MCCNLRVVSNHSEGMATSSDIFVRSPVCQALYMACSSRSSTDASTRVSKTESSGAGSSSPKAPLLPLGLRDYLAGLVSGIGKVVAGHPFDTVKVRVQSGNYRSSFDCLAKTVRQEGFLALYQGMSLPLVFVCAVGGILFSINGQIRAVIQPDPRQKLTYYQMLIAGMGSGFCVGVAVTPPEVVKLRMQVENRKATSAATPGGGSKVINVMREIGLRNLWAGSTPTFIREVGTFGLFFPLNEIIKDALLGSEHATPSLGTRIFAAGCAGILAWLPCYPVDVVKSHMQLSAASKMQEGHPKFSSMGQCIRYVYRTEGIRRGFFRGLTPCLARAFPAYAAQYILYEQARVVLG